MTHSGLLESFQGGTGHTRKTKPMIRGLALSAPPPNLHKGKEELDIEFNHLANDLIDCAYLMKPQIKTETMRLRQLPGR